MSDRIILPQEWLPLVDDWQRLLILHDYLLERGDVDLARQCRWTAFEWRDGRGLKRKDVEAGALVWARFGRQGWSRAIVDRVTDRHVYVTFPHRRGRVWTEFGIQRATRAWWDLEPRQDWRGDQYRHPKPRKGYGVQRNAELAAALTGPWPPLKVEPEIVTGGLFDA